MSEFEKKVSSLDEYIQKNAKLSDLMMTQRAQVDRAYEWSEKHPILTALLAIGSVAVLGKGRVFQRIAANMQQSIQGFYGAGVTKWGKAGAFTREALKGITPARQQVFNQRINRAYKQYGFGAGQKRDLDRIFKGYHSVTSDKRNWVGGILGSSKGLTPQAAKQITQLGKEELGIMHNAFAQQVKIRGLKKAKKMDLYNLIKDEAKYEKYGIGGKGKMTTLFKDMGIEDPEVGKIALNKWNQGLVPKLRGIHKGSKSINVATFRQTPMQKSVIDAQFSSQAKIAFLAHKAGLMKKGTHLNKLGNYFQKRGYDKIVSEGKKHVVLEGKTYRVALHKTKQGSTLVNFSPSRKSNYHWGGFNGNLVFNEAKRKGQVGIFGTDVYDIEIMKLKGDALAKFRKTPLLNVQTVKYKDVPIINQGKAPKKWVQKKPKEVSMYNKKVFNDEKMQTEMDKITDTGKYGIKDVQTESPYATQRFEFLSRPTMGQAKRMKGGAIVDTRGPLKTYSRHTLRWNKAVEDYYKLYTKSMTETLTPLERAKFMSTRTMLGMAIPAAGAVGSLPWLLDDED